MRFDELLIEGETLAERILDVDQRWMALWQRPDQLLLYSMTPFKPNPTTFKMVIEMSGSTRIGASLDQNEEIIVIWDDAGRLLCIDLDTGETISSHRL